MNDEIIIRGAKQHNLKNIDINLPKNKLIVMSGLSGSGKSSLAFDTIFAEGQRRYVESLSAYARQFLGRLDKPNVDTIEGLSPAIAIEQKSTHKNPRSIVGTITEIYDYYRLLWARCGHVHCPICGKEISEMSVDQIIDIIFSHQEGGRLIISSPVARGKKGEFKKVFDDALQAGYTRCIVDGKMFMLEDEIPSLDKQFKHSISVVIDRLLNRKEDRARLADAIESATDMSDGLVEVEYVTEGKKELYSEKNSCPDCGITIPEVEPRFFSFNNPYGACPSCNGLGFKSEFDIKKIIPDPTKSYNEGGIVTHSPTQNFSGSYIKALAKAYNFSLDLPLQDWPKEAKKVLLYGGGKVLDVEYENGKKTTKYHMNEQYPGIIKELDRRYYETQSIYIRSWLDTLKETRLCPDCNGQRLRKEALNILIGGKNIWEVTSLSVKESLEFFNNLNLTETEIKISKEILKEIKARLNFLKNVGLNYLTLSRASATLSGGEAQRIRLATQIGSALTGVMYVLDEPSIGLHQRDNEKLINTLKELKELGNTVIVVEHDEDTIRAADYVVDLGPGAGEHGGEVIAKGTPEEIEKNEKSITGAFLSKRLTIPVPAVRREGNGKELVLHDCTMNNLKNITAHIPLGKLVILTGVSGSGKSTLLNELLIPSIKAHLDKKKDKNIDGCGPLEGFSNIDKVINIDQSPIGRTPRSNPATYVGLYTSIRDLFASLPESKARGFKSGRFSFNVPGGRCENCQGDGTIKIEMHFLPDVYVPCDVCHGKRYNKETLQVQYKGKNISDVLDMTVSEAYEFFNAIPAIKNKLETLMSVGLDYIHLGQSALTLSGGEAQRVKLSLELSKRSTGKTLYVLDEPTTGLHFADVKKLMEVINSLVDQGNSVILIEHNLDVIKCADYIIDLGPEGGDEGGRIIAEGTPEEVAKVEESYTGQFLRRYLAN
ncbi:excinuclease ABC subunit UvrA [Spirochaetales bacterium NM-380-WT-3C1]|uniref:UvrABC system protein A n=1 Tax=Bullifex porci TaxID=2606638 RepID=A0A7X2PBT1_9SPIO|nr:excinuclease ABC subunit UvrA [Bullifex porci]MSU05984.1 excinuclease ABC subunit UvrA [Bullifex porci]